MAANLPESIEGYRIGARIRESGVLAVHAGTSRLDLPVHAFLARADALTGGFEADDFVAGVRRAAGVQHEALLPFVTGGRSGEHVFAIAKSVEGRTLDAAVAADGPFSEVRTLSLAASMAGALAALERAGMRHGDLAPERILIAGLDAFVVEPPRLMPSSLVPRAERWQAPEEARGGENGVQSDQFVLGLILVTALTGAHPLASATDARRALRDWKAPDPATLLRGASAPTRAVVARLLAPEPSNRFPNATDALRAIRDAASTLAAAPETAPIGAPLTVPRAAAPEAAKRTPGRLYVDARLGEAMVEIDDDVVYVGASPGKNVRAQPEPFAEALIRVERTPAADVVHQVSGELGVNGRTVTSHPLADGDRIVAPGISARYERATRTVQRAAAATAPAAAPGNPLAGFVTAIAMLGTMAALGWGAWRLMGTSKEAADALALAARAEQNRDEEKRSLAPEGTGSKQPSLGPADVERAARAAYETAARTARSRPSEARARYYEVWQRYPEAAYGLLARLDALEIDRRVRPPADATFEALLALADAPGGVLDDESVSKLRTYVEDHPGTLAGARAHVALVKSQAVQRGRFDADIAAVRAAVAKKDWREALTLVAKMRDYVPPSLSDEVLAERRKIEEGMGETLRESPGRSGGAPGDGAKPKEPGPAGGDAADRNRQAEELFRNGRRLMDGGKEVEALDAFLAFLRDFKDTPNGTKYDPEVRGRISTLSTGTAGIVRLFRGKAERADKGRWRISYDFQDPRQFEDFRDLAAFESPPRANWKTEGGAVRCSRGSGALVLDAVFGAGEISTSVLIHADRPHDLGVMFLDPTEQRRFYLFTLQNTFFTLGLGPGAKPFLENAIVLFGPNMWRDTQPGQLGFVRKCGSEEPTVRPSEPTPIKAGKSDAEVWMKFEGGRSIRGSAYGDVKYEFPSVTPGMFVLGSAGFFDDFVVEGTPDADWVQKRWRAILSGL